MDTKKLLLIFSVLIIIACLGVEVFLILKFPIANNEAFFAVRANAVSNGKILYTGNLFNNHGPLAIYFLSFFSKFFKLSTISLHMAGFFWDILILISLFFISKKYFGTKSAIIASAIYMVLSIAFYGVIYNSEYPATFFGLLGMFFYFLFLEKNKKISLFIAGLMIGISLWFKQPGFFFFLAIFIHQLCLYFKKKETKAIRNIIIVVLGVLCISIPLLIYFFYYTGWKFLQDMIIFNLIAKTRNSRILITGEFLRMLLQYFGFLFVIIIAAPKKQESGSKKDIMIFSLIYIIIMLVFYLLNTELFSTHLIQLAPVLIIYAMFCIKKYEAEHLKIIRIFLIISLLTIFMVSLEEIARENAKGEKIKQQEIKAFMDSNIPKASVVYSVYDAYPFLGGFENPYRWTTLQPNVESIDNFDDFCDFINNVDYIIFTGHQKKYLGEKNLECAYKKFQLIKRFDDVGQSYVEILKHISAT